jgi:hypothetical protein
MGRLLREPKKGVSSRFPLISGKGGPSFGIEKKGRLARVTVAEGRISGTPHPLHSAILAHTGAYAVIASGNQAPDLCQPLVVDSERVVSCFMLLETLIYYASSGRSNIIYSIIIMTGTPIRNQDIYCDTQ